MEKLFKKIDSNYFLELGDKKLSPLSQASIGLSMIYIDKFETINQQPLLIGYPNKRWATIWVTFGIAINLFYRERQESKENRLKSLNLKPGDKIEIFGKSSVWKGFDASKNGKIVITEPIKNSYGLRESQESDYPLPEHWIPFINKDTSTRSSKISLKQLNKELQERRENRNALEKILGYQDKGLGINPSILKSRILVVSGRGDKGKFISQIKETQVFNESLSDVFQLGKNVTVEVDLEKYKYLAKDNSEENERFTKISIHFLNSLKESDKLLSKATSDLLRILENGNFLTENFIQKFEDLEPFLEDEELNRHSNLIKMFPGSNTETLKDLKVVIINDVSTLIDYQETVKCLSEKGIPVIILSDFYSDFDQRTSEIDPLHRIFWNTSKIYALKKFEEDSDLLDDELWSLSKRFSDQIILINSYGEGTLEKVFSELTRTIYSIDGLENFKKVFWKICFPLYHAIKNNPTNIDKDDLDSYLKPFLEEFKNASGMPEFISKRVKEIIQILGDFQNSKAVEERGITYKQKILVDNTEITIPSDKEVFEKTIVIPTINNKKLLFTGEPYREKYIGVLKRCCIRLFIPQIDVLCWPKESVKVYKYLYQFYQEKIFKDNSSQIIEISNGLLLEEDREIEGEINEILQIHHRKGIPKPKGGKDLFVDLRNYNHSSYNKGAGVDKVNVEILTFTNGDWMYLPRTSKVLALSYSAKGGISLNKLSFSSLRKETQIIQYSLQRKELRDMAKSKNKLYRIFDDLYFWRRILEELFEQNSSDYKTLKEFLEEIKSTKNLEGNPSVQNLIRWRNDDEILAPSPQHLKLILNASDQGRLYNRVDTARREIRKFDNDIRQKIKKQVLEQLLEIFKGEQKSENFSIKVSGFSIKINLRTIHSLDEEPFPVAYSDTRKIISE